MPARKAVFHGKRLGYTFRIRNGARLSEGALRRRDPTFSVAASGRLAEARFLGKPMRESGSEGQLTELVELLLDQHRIVLIVLDEQDLER